MHQSRTDALLLGALETPETAPAIPILHAAQCYRLTSHKIAEFSETLVYDGWALPGQD